MRNAPVAPGRSTRREHPNPRQTKPKGRNTPIRQTARLIYANVRLILHSPMRLLALLLLLVAAPASATTVKPPAFAELVAEAATIFRGEVTQVATAVVEERGERPIVTRVTFRVERMLKGEAADTISLEFLGGAVGRRRLHVHGQPAFAVGERGVYFVEATTGRLCPLVRLRHGRYRVRSDPAGGAERVLRDDYSPVVAPEAVQGALEDGRRAPLALDVGTAQTLAQFEDAVVAATHGVANGSTR